MNHLQHKLSRIPRTKMTQLTVGEKVTIGPKTESPEHSIKVHRTEAGIESIELTCSCGEKILVRCEYE